MSADTVIFFEVYSPLQVLMAWRRVRAASRVVFSRRTPFVAPPARAKRIAVALVRRLNRSAEIRELTVADLLEYLPLNKQAIRVLDSMKGEIAGTKTFERMHGLIENEALVRYYQAGIVRDAATWALFPAAADKTGAHAHDCYSDWDTAAFASRFPGVVVRNAGRMGAAVRRRAARWRARFEAVAVILVLVLRARRRGRIATPRGPFAVGLPVWWGISDTDSHSPNLRRPHADDQLYGGALQAGDIVHLFGDVPFPPAQIRSFRRAMDTRGYAHVDLTGLRLGPASASAALRAFRAALSLSLPHSGTPLDDAVLRETPKALYHFLRKHLILDNVAYRAELVRNDYNPGHIVASSVCRARGVRTVAVQHNVLPYEGPQVAFIGTDELSIFGEFYRKGFAPHWERLQLHAVGRESLDWTVAIASRPRVLEDARRRWRAFRESDRPFAVVIFPNDREICIEPQWHEFYRGLEAFARTTADVDVVFRFRNEQSVRAPYVSQYLGLPEHDPRFVVVWHEFTTYELMAMSAVVISHDGSFSVNESLALGRPVFTFEFVMAGRHYFPETYGRDFVLNSADALVRVLEAVPSGYHGFDCDWRALSRDLNAHADGANGDRLRVLMERAAGIESAGRTAEARR